MKHETVDVKQMKTYPKGKFREKSNNGLVKHWLKKSMIVNG